MFNIDIKLLAALAPAIFCILLLAGIYVRPWLSGAFARLSNDEDRLEWYYHVVLHGAFYGTVFNIIFGVDAHSATGEAITAGWFLVCLKVSRLLGKQLSGLREAERHKDHRRLAGTVRSIVKSELLAKPAEQVDSIGNEG